MIEAYGYRIEDSDTAQHVRHIPSNLSTIMRYVTQLTRIRKTFVPVESESSTEESSGYIGIVVSFQVIGKKAYKSCRTKV